MTRHPANFVLVEAGPVPITAGFLRQVHERLSALADALDRQEVSARRLVREARRDVAVTDRNWRGPRSRKVVGSATTYLDAIDPYADAIASGKHTIRRWARVASETAEQLARLEQVNAGPPVYAVAWCATPDESPGRGWCGTPSDPVEEIRAAWRQHSRRMGAELDAATTAITNANAAVATNIASDKPFELRQQLGLQNLRGPEHVRVWWNGLTDGEQLAMLTAYPGLLARVDGLPPRIHTQARRTRAGERLVRLEQLAATGDLTPQQARRLREIRAELGSLEDDRPRSGVVAEFEVVTTPHLVAVSVEDALGVDATTICQSPINPPPITRDV